MKKYAFQLPNGILILYGENLTSCIPYIDNCVDSAEDICEYCSDHGISLEYRTWTVKGIIEYLRIVRVGRKYGIRVKFRWMKYSDC